MKTRDLRFTPKIVGLLLLAGAVAAQAQTTYIKQANATAINASGSWSAGGPPGAGDIGEWTSVATATGDTITSVGGSYSLGEIQIASPVGAVSLTDATIGDVLTINGATGTGVGVDMSAASQNFTLGTSLTLGGNQSWKISSARTLTYSGANNVNLGANTLTISGGGTFSYIPFNNAGANSAISSVGAALVNSGSTISAQISAGTAYVNYFGANTALTNTPSTTAYSIMNVGENANSAGNCKQTYTSLTLNPGTSLFQDTGRKASSGNSVGFTALYRNAGSMADFINNSGSGVWGAANNGYALPGSTVLGYATQAINDWIVPKGAATATGTPTYTADVFTTSTADVNETINDSPATFTINSLRFNTAAANILTLTGVNTIASGGILVGSTVAANITTITGGSLTSGDTTADGLHDLIIINNTGSSGNINVYSTLVDNGGSPVGLTVGTTSTTTPTGFISLSAANTFSGTTTITKGTLMLSNSLALQNSTLNYNFPGSINFGPLTAATLAGLNGTVSLALPSSFALTLGNNNASSTYSGALSGVGASLTKTGTGTLTLNANNLYTGNTTVSAGTLALGAAGTFGGVATLASTATLDLSAAGNYLLAGTVSGTGAIKGGLTLNSGGQLSPTGSTGVLTLSSNLTLNGGTVAVSVNASAPANGIINIGSAGGGNLTNISGTVQLSITGTLANGTYKIIGVPNGTIIGAGSLLSVSGFAQTGQTAALVANTHELDLVVSTYVSQNLIWKGDGSANLWNVNTALNWNDTGPTVANPSVFKNGDNTTLDDSSVNPTVNLSGTLSPASVTVNGTQSYVLTSTGKISGSAALTNNNSGTLTVLTTNDYTGGTLISSGTVQVGNGTTTGGEIGTGPVKDNAALVFDLPAGSQTVGAISGTGTLTTTGSGTIVLNGADTLAGATTITTGAIKQGASNVLPHGSGVGDTTVNGTLDLGGQSGTVNGLFGTTTGTINNSGAPAVTLTVLGSSTVNPSTFGGLIANTGGALALNFNGSGNELQLTTNNTYTGGTTVTAGTLQVGDTNALSSGSVSVISGGTLDLNGFSPTVDALTGSGIIDDVSAAGTSALSIGNNGGSGTFTGTIQNSSGTVSLAKNGTGTEIINGNNSFSGAATVNAGILQLNSSGVINNASASGVGANGAAQFVINGGSMNVASFNVANPSVGLLVSSGSANISGALTMNSGTSAASSGSLIASTGGSLNAGSITTGRGASSFTTQPATGSTTEGIYITGGSVNVTGNVGVGTPGSANSSATARIDGGSWTIGGSLTVGLNNGGRWSIIDANGGSLTVNDTATGLSIGGPTAGNAVVLVRGGTNTFAKISFGQGTVVESNILLQTGGSMYIGSGGMALVSTGAGSGNQLDTIYLTNGILGAAADWASPLPMLLTGPNYTIQTADINGTPHNILLTGVLGGNAGSALTVDGGGSLTMTAANYYTSGTTVSNSLLNINGIYALGGANYGGLTLTGGGTLQYSTNSTGNGSLDLTSIGSAGVTLASGSEIIDVNGNSVTYGNAIGNSGSGSLTVKSTIAGGALNLSAANTYTGNTTINGGTLNVNGSISSAHVTASGGALGGVGTASGAAEIQSSGILAPGTNGVGTLTLGNLTIDSGSINNFGFSGATNAQAVVTTSGGFVVNDSSDNALFNLYAAGGTAPWTTIGTYKLIQFSGSAPTLDSSWTTSSATNPHIGNPQVNCLYKFTISSGYLTVTIALSGSAVAGVWTNNADGSWATGANWSSNPNVPHSAGDIATFGNSTAFRTVTLNANESVGTVTFNNANSFAIANGGKTLTIDNTGSGANVYVLGGTANSVSTPVALNDNTTVNVGLGNSLAVSATIANSPSVTKVLTATGSGTLALSGNNSYGPAAASGFGTTLNGPTLQVGNNNALAAGDVSVSGNSTLQAGAAGLTLPNNVDIASGMTVTVNNNGNNLALNGTISDSGALTKAGAGTLALNAVNNSYSGNTTINAGVLSISAPGNLPTGTTVILNGGDLLGNGTVSIFPNVNIGAASGSLPGTGLVDAASGQTFSITGTIGTAGNTGSNNIVINSGAGNNGTVIFQGANTYNGYTTISNGLLDVQGSQALQNSTVNYNNQGGALVFDAGITSATLGGLTGAQNLGLTNLAQGAMALTVGNNGASTTYSGGMNDNGYASSLTKSGIGTLILAGTNNMAGPVTAGAGTLQLTTNGILYTSAANISAVGGAQLVVSGGTLVATNASSVGNPSAGLHVSAGSATFLGGVTEGSAANGTYIGVTGGSLTMASLGLGRTGLSYTAQPTAGDLANGLYISNGVVNITGNLSMGTASAANSSVNTRIDAGTLNVGGSVTIGLNNGGRWSVVDVDGGTLNVTDVVTGVSVGGPLVGNAELLIRAGVANIGIVGLGNGVVADTAVLNLIGGALYVGSGGIVQVSPAVTPVITLGGGILGASTNWVCTNTVQLTGAATVQAGDASGNAQTISLAGPITGTGPLITSGHGTNILSGVNTFTGSTIVSNGTLSLIAPGSLATTAQVLIGTGATFDISTLGSYAFTIGQALGGSGTNGIGHLAAGGNTVTLNSGATGYFQAAGGPGGSVEKVSVAGNLTLNGNVITINANGTPFGAGTYRLLDCTGTLTGSANSAPVFTGAGSNGGAASIATTTGAAGHVDLTVAKATPILQTAPTASNIAAGSALSTSVLSGGSITNASGTSVAGTFAFAAPATTPPVGTANQSVTFTPTDTADYNTVSLSVPVTVVSSVLVPTVPPKIANLTLVNGNVVITGTNAQSGGTYYLLTSTNLVLPLAQWTAAATNVVNTNGNNGGFTFIGTNVVTPNTAKQFYILSSTNN